MKNFILTILLACFVFSLNAQKHIYHDLEGNVIKKEAFEELRERGKIEGFREENGKIVHYYFIRKQEHLLSETEFASIKDGLQSYTKKSLDALDYIVIRYYPGKDRNNSTGMATREWLRQGYMDYQSGLKNYKNVADIINLNIYKNDEGLKRYSSGRKWHLDPEQIVENTFFDYHYWGASYAIIHKSGFYVTHFGEYHHDQILNDLFLLVEHFKEQ